MFFFSSRRRHTRYWRDWSSDVCSSDLAAELAGRRAELDRARVCLATLARRAGRYAEARALLRTVLETTAEREEIGRASCRERVEISGVGGSLKKKKISSPYMYKTRLNL